MPSTIETFPCMDGATRYSVVKFSRITCFSIAFTNALFVEQCSIEPSDAKRDRGTRETSYTSTALAMLISVGDLHTIIIRAKRQLSSCSSTTLLSTYTLVFFPVVFHVSSFCFFIDDNRFSLPVSICSFANTVKSLNPILTLVTHHHLWLPPALLPSSPG